jgi:hypothetical protein
VARAPGEEQKALGTEKGEEVKQIMKRWQVTFLAVPVAVALAATACAGMAEAA